MYNQTTFRQKEKQKLNKMKWLDGSTFMHRSSYGKSYLRTYMHVSITAIKPWLSLSKRMRKNLL